MPSVQDYLRAKKAVEGSIDTLQRRLRSAYDAAQAGMNDGTTYDRLERLTTESARSKFKDDLTSPLVTPLQPTIAAMPEESAIAEAKAMIGFYGLTRDMVIKYVEGARDQVSFEGFWKFVHQQPTYKQVLESTRNAPLTIVDKISVAEVARYVGMGVAGSSTSRPSTTLSATPAVQGSSLLIQRPDMVTLADKVELIDLYERLGIIPQKLVQDKPYMKLA